MTKYEKRIQNVNNMIAILDEFLARGYYVHSGPFMIRPGATMKEFSDDDLLLFFAYDDRWVVHNEHKYVVVTYYSFITM